MDSLRKEQYAEENPVTIKNSQNRISTDGEDIDFHIQNGVKASQDNIKIAGNLYLSTSNDQTTMLEAYHTLYENTPLIKEGHFALNNKIRELISNNLELVIVDAGIGLGYQWRHFIQSITQLPKKLTIIGIDLQMHCDHLSPIKQSLTQLAEQKGLPFSFESVYGSFETIDLERLINRKRAKTVVNMSLFLHHIPPEEVLNDDSALGRNGVLKKIRQFNPDLLTLLEPDSDHNSLSFERTLLEVKRHYGAVFSVLDKFIEDAAIRSTIKNLFFGREIFNILACDGIERVERHERHEQWQRRMSKAGFSELEITQNDHSGARRIGHGGVNLLTASAWHSFRSR